MISSERQVYWPHLRQYRAADKADALFKEVLKTSTSSETYYNYASFLLGKTEKRSPQYCPQYPGEKADHARISAPSRTSMVPSCQLVAEASELRTGNRQL